MEASVNFPALSSSYGIAVGSKLGFPQSALHKGVHLSLLMPSSSNSKILSYRGFKKIKNGKQAKKIIISPINGIDSNQHNATDHSENASDENRQDSRTDSIEGQVEPRSGIRPSQTEVPVSLPKGGDTSSHGIVEGLVLGLCQERDAFDSEKVESPVVRRYASDNEERWLLWYSGKSAKLQGANGDVNKANSVVMGLSTSYNGVHWKRSTSTTDVNEEGVGKVLDCSTDWWSFDTETIAPSDVLVMSSLKGRVTAGVYWMYYTGGSSEEVEIPKPENFPENVPDFKFIDGNMIVRRTRPGLTLSHDGRNWARIEGDHHSGALFDAGGDTDWDSLYVAAPHVVFSGAEDLRMYYHSFDKKAGCFSIGYARSRDGQQWIKCGKVLGGGIPGSFDELGVKCPQVIRHPDGDGFLMIYEGVATDGKSSFGLARSKDGLSKWERCSSNPVFTASPTENAWDAKEIHSPCLVQMDRNEWRLYYQGVSACGRSGIGMAVCTDGKLQKFKRCLGLHL